MKSNLITIRVSKEYGRITFKRDLGSIHGKSYRLTVKRWNLILQSNAKHITVNGYTVFLP